MTTWFYVFADGYCCWVAGKLSACDLRNEVKAHGAVVRMTPTR